MAAMTTELGEMAVLEVDEVSMIEKKVLAHIHMRLQQWRYAVYHPVHCDRKSSCRCGARLPFGGVKVVLAGDFGQLPPVAVKEERTLLNMSAQVSGKDNLEVNLGARLFNSIRNVIRLRRIHRQVGVSPYKEPLLRLRDAAHTKEDVALWKTHDLTSAECALSPEEIRSFHKDRVHLFCEKQRAGQFNGRRLGEDATAQGGTGILRVWSVESNPLVERYSCDAFGGLRRVLHFTLGAPVMLISNVRTVWNLVNGLRGKIVGVVWSETAVASVFSDGAAREPSARPKRRNAAEVDFGQLPPVAVKEERTLLNMSAQVSGKDNLEVNLGARLFNSIRNVIRLRRIHRQVGVSPYKESLLRLRDAAHTKEDVALWKTHDLTSAECALSPEEIRSFHKDRVHLFCEKQRAGQFNGRRLGEDATAQGGAGILRVWSVESNPLVERYSCDAFGGLRRVLHFTLGAPVMLISNVRTVWNLVNGLRGKIVGVVWSETAVASVFSDGAAREPSARPKRRNAAEVESTTRQRHVTSSAKRRCKMTLTVTGNGQR
eukprot:Skav236340  [mRNA]  locus=scaffold918:1:1632:+ [translate_table: standard]